MTISAIRRRFALNGYRLRSRAGYNQVVDANRCLVHDGGCDGYPLAPSDLEALVAFLCD